MRAVRTFVLGMVAGAVLLYVLLWRAHALAPPDLSRAARAPAIARATPGPRGEASAAPPAAATAREPGGESTDAWMSYGPLSGRPDIAASPAPLPGDLARLQERSLAFPVSGFDRRKLRDNFAEMRGGTRVHEALDMPAPRGTPVLAVDDGPVRKLFNSRAGGLTVYQFDRTETFCYYYAHLDRYADGLAEGRVLAKGETLGYVGTTGNAPPGVPHLHFTVFKLGPEKRWWEGIPINPFPLWAMR